MWWGGLTFYAVIVVPIGTATIGSVEQGFITQRVTQWHNGLTVILVVCLTCESVRQRSRGLGLLSGGLALVTLALISWHARLTGQMNFADHTVAVEFYLEHAVYLWMIAVEWGLGIVASWWLCRRRE